MKIAVIGATGMLGHHTARAVINAGHDLCVVHRKSSNLEKLGKLRFETAEGDLDDADSLSRALKGCDAAINCAAYYPDLPRHVADEVAVATRQMSAFYKAVKTQNLSKAVYLGGSIALPRHPQGEPGNESLLYTTAPRWKNAYLHVKWAMDKQAREMAQSGLPIVIAIPTMTFGEYDYGPTTGRLITEVARQSMPAYVSGKRNIVYAGDAGRGIVLALEKGRPGERYLIGGENITMTRLIMKIAEIAQVDAPRAVPLPLAKALSGLQYWRYHYLNGPAPKISETAIAVMAGGQFIDGTKAEVELGYKAEISSDEALQRAYHWFQSEGYISSPTNQA